MNVGKGIILCRKQLMTQAERIKEMPECWIPQPKLEIMILKIDNITRCSNSVEALDVLEDIEQNFKLNENMKILVDYYKDFFGIKHKKYMKKYIKEMREENE